MIYSDVTITVKGNTATLDNDLYLYKNDKNITINISIVNSIWNFAKKLENNIIEKTEATFFTLRWMKGDKVKKVFEDQQIKKGKCEFVITEELIDEDIEMGDYDFQISLLDEEKNSILSIPPVIGQIHINKHIFEDEEVITDTNEVNVATVGLAKTTTGEAVSVVDDEGNYIKTEWLDGDVITKEKLNKIEEGIYNNSSQCKDIANYSLTKGTDGKVYIKKQDGTLIGEGIEVGSNADLSKITMRMNGQTLKLMNGEEQVASVDLPVGTGEIPDNTVLYEEDSESMGDVITAENITIKDTNNNFTSTHVEGALNELFQSASNGKTLIANAITGKGVKTNATDSFQTMATNIENISGGSGGITPTGTKEITQNGTYDVTNFATVLVNVTSSGGTLESGTITPTKQSTTLDIPTTKKCSNLVFFQHEMKPGVGYRMLTGLIRCGGVGINLASNSNGSTLNVIGTSGNTLECVVVTFNDNSIHISSNKDTGGGGYLVDKQYDWYAW